MKLRFKKVPYIEISYTQNFYIFKGFDIFVNSLPNRSHDSFESGSVEFYALQVSLSDDGSCTRSIQQKSNFSCKFEFKGKTIF